MRKYFTYSLVPDSFYICGLQSMCTVLNWHTRLVCILDNLSSLISLLCNVTGTFKCKSKMKLKLSYVKQGTNISPLPCTLTIRVTLGVHVDRDASASSLMPLDV